MTPACPLATVIYRFDDASRFPVFESHTTAKEPVTLQTERDDIGDYLRVAYERSEADPAEFSIVLALPLVAVDGRPRQLLLDVLGDASGCQLQLEGTDGRGENCLVSFGIVGFRGWRILGADPSRLIPPLQFHRLGIIAAPSSVTVHLGIRSLSLTGPVRLAPPGVAG